MVADYYGLIKNKISIDTFAFKNNLNFSLDLWKRYFRSNKLINLVFLHYFLLEYIPYPGYLCQVTLLFPSLFRFFLDFLFPNFSSRFRSQPLLLSSIFSELVTTLVALFSYQLALPIISSFSSIFFFHFKNITGFKETTIHEKPKIINVN